MNEPITFLVWTENSPGVLLRLTTLFTRRKINVESLTVSATETEGISRFTIVILADPSLAATIGRQIERIIETRRVFVFTDRDIVHREVALIRAAIAENKAHEILAQHPEARLLDHGTSGALFQVAGTEHDINRLLKELERDGINEVVRSGRIAVTPAGDYDNDLSRSMHELRPTASEGPDF
jgi:acetolactate synthase-1/3 small subunit